MRPDLQELERAAERGIMADPAIMAAAKPNGKPKVAKPEYDVQAISAFDLWDADVPEPEAIVEGVLYRGLTLLAGRPKIGKSLAALDLAMAIASGRNAFGVMPVKASGGVLYCDLENSRGTTKKRLRNFLSERTPYLQNLTFIRRLPKINEGGLDLLDEMLTAHPRELVVIDTLAKIVTPDKNRDAVRSDYTEVDRVRKLTEKHHCALLLVCHTRKMDADYAVDAVSGTTGVTAAADCVLVLKRDGRGGYVLSVNGRDVESTDFAMDFNNGHWKLRGAANLTNLTDAQQDVLKVFEREGKDAMLPVEKIARLAGRQLPATHVLVHRMVEDGLIQRVSRGLYRVVTPPPSLYRNE